MNEGKQVLDNIHIKNTFHDDVFQIKKNWKTEHALQDKIIREE